jgi:hypothetical protein
MMFKFTDREKLFGIIIVAMLLVFGFREGCNQRDKDSLLKNAITYQDSAKFYKLKVNGNPVDVAFNQSLMLENKKQLEAMVAKNDTLAKLVSRFKDIRSTTIIKEYFRVEHDTIMLSQQIPCDFKPIKVIRDSAYYHFRGTIAPKYFTIDSLAIPNTQSIVIGKKKLGFLKGSEERVEIINSNPLMKTTNVGNYVIQKDKKWYNRNTFWGIVGVATGSVIVGVLHK